jgi:hypothetical protein
MSKKQESKRKAVSRLSDAESSARRSGLNPEQIEARAEALASDMFIETGSQRFATACYQLWTNGISPIKRDVKPHRTSDEERIAWLAYKERAWELTRMQPIETLTGYDKRGFNGWHLDHVLSIHEAFKRGLPPEVPACMSNLRMIPAKENTLKNTSTVFTDLFNGVR